MTNAEAHDKAVKLLALAAPGSGASPAEAATAARIASQICAKYGIRPSPPSRASGTSRNALPGQVMPGWRPPRQPSWSPWTVPPPRSRPFGNYDVGISDISDARARDMALVLMTSGAYFSPGDLELIEGALNGLLTEYGKILLDGLYALL